MVGHVGIIQDILWADKHNNNSTRDDIHNLSCECELNAYLWMISTEFKQQNFAEPEIDFWSTHEIIFC